MKIELRSNNQILTANKDGKIPIRISNNILLHTPEDLLEASIGGCFGLALINECKKYNYNFSLFEITVSLHDNCIYVNHAESIPENLKTDIFFICTNISKYLINKPNIVLNQKPTEAIIENKKGCCN